MSRRCKSPQCPRSRADFGPQASLSRDAQVGCPPVHLAHVHSSHSRDPPAPTSLHAPSRSRTTAGHTASGSVR